jgi:hypothetical protein
MDIGEVLTRAWQIIWKHKVLWIFGILAGCVNAGGSAGNSGTSYQGNAPPPQFDSFVNQVPDWQIAFIIGVVILVILIIALIAIFLGTIGRVGLIRGTYQADQGAAKLSFGELFSGSMPYFWRVFALNLLVGIVIFAAVMLISIVAIVGVVLSFGIGLLCVIPMICVLVPVAWVISVWVNQANVAIVVEDLGIMDGLRRGWQIIRENAGAYIIAWLILGIISLVAGFIIGLPLIITLGPIMVAIFAGTERALASGVLLAALCFVGWLPVLIVLSGILRSYIDAAWTLTFMRLTNRLPVEVEPETLPEPAS